ncbi:MAG: hypothetical protein A2V66_02715 [Ignavibacteria bacterium RBG_13_36_8]|nr:MAG: hypothetical protein A2V66_02715 [Ignavibacteria bacterium RBG_13_36_8]
MKVSGILTAVLFLGIFISTSTAQVTFQLGGGIGYVMSAGDYKGTTVGYYDGTNYGMSGGYNIHAKARVGLLSFIAIGEINYNMLSNDGAYNDAGQGSVDVSLNVLSLRIGSEFHLGLPLVPIDPYVGANFQINSFSGSVDFQGVTHVSSGTVDIASATRYGAGINGGVIFSVGGMKVDLNASYNMLNLFGKEYVSAGNQRIDSYKNLNDEEDPGYSSGDVDHFIPDSRSLSDIEIKATLMFGL